MSSDLLEQAMIDAAALKEAAMKNAENALIEKYSAEFNETVQKLLEQEEPTAATPAASADAVAAPAPELSTTDLNSGAEGLEMADDQNKAFKGVPGSFSGDEDEMININFDQIKATLNEMLGVKEMHDAGGKYEPMTGDASDQGGNPLIVRINNASSGVVDDSVEEVQLELEEDDSEFSNTEPEGEMMELEEVELEEGSADSQLANAKAKKADADRTVAQAEMAKAKESADEEKKAQDAALAASAKSAASAGTAIPSVTEAIELSEEELQELAEELKVDLKVGNLSDGYMGSTETQKREQRNVELAAARDEKATKDREEELKKMKDLVSENNQLKSLNNDALNAVTVLKEQIEKLNVLNAKLLYTNKALGNISLNERQKNNIVESISKADSVLAAKTIYETVQNAVENIAKEKEAPQSLRETINRAATPFVVKKNANNNINDLMAERLKALAGIKKLS